MLCSGERGISDENSASVILCRGAIELVEEEGASSNTDQDANPNAKVAVNIKHVTVVVLPALRKEFKYHYMIDNNVARREIRLKDGN